MKPLRMRVGLLSLGLGLAILQAGPARAGQLAINPVQIKLDGEASSEVLSMRNTGTSEVRYEIRAYSWSEPAQGEPRLVPTEDVAVFPPLLSIAPAETRKVRVGALVAPAAVERTYRIILEELPSPTKGVGVQFLNRISIPIFVAPSSSRVSSAVESAGADKGGARFRVRNTGTIHLRPKTVSARALDGQGATVAEKSWDGWYVLAGGEKLYSVPLPSKACARVRTLDVTVQTDDGPVHKSVATPQGACGT